MRKPYESVIRGKRMNFYLADVQIKRLKRISQRMGLSASEILRRAIDEYWEEVQKKKKRK